MSGPATAALAAYKQTPWGSCYLRAIVIDKRGCHYSFPANGPANMGKCRRRRQQLVLRFI